MRAFLRRLFSRWYGFHDAPIYRAQLDRFAACQDVPEIRQPRVVFTGYEQKEKRHAEPTVCKKCGGFTGYNDGVQPCNACFVAGLEAAQEVIGQRSSKVTRFERREK